MKFLLITILSLLSLTTIAQVPKTNQFLGNFNVRVVTRDQLVVDSAFRLPKDTIKLLPADTGFLVLKNGIIYRWALQGSVYQWVPQITPTLWGQIGGTLSNQIDLQNALNAKQNTITTGTTSQYFRGDLSLATFPTNVSTFTNDAGYLTSSSAGSLYVPLGRTLTINGNTQDLTANRTWSVGTVTSVGLSLGWGLTGLTGSPVTTSGSIGFRLDSTLVYSKYADDTAKAAIRNSLNTKWTLGGDAPTSPQNLGTTTAQPLPFITNNTEKMRILSGGNILIGNTTDDGTGKLQVYGRSNFYGPTGVQLFAQPNGCTGCTIFQTIQNTSDSTGLAYVLNPTTVEKSIGYIVARGTIASPTIGLKFGVISGSEYGIGTLGAATDIYFSGNLIWNGTAKAIGNAGRFWSGVFANSFTAQSGVPTNPNGVFNTSSYNYSLSATGTRGWVVTSTVSNSGATYAPDTLVAFRKPINRGVGNSGKEEIINLRFIHTSGGNDSLKAIDASEGELYFGYDTTYHKWGLRVGVTPYAATRDTNAIFQVVGPSRYSLLPKSTLAQRGFMTGTPSTGALLFQTDNTPGFYYYNGSAWVRMGSEDRSFVQGGNSFGTTATIGTGDANSLNINTNGTTKLSIGTTIPTGSPTDSILTINNTILQKVARTTTSFVNTTSTTDATPTTITTIAVPTNATIIVEVDITFANGSDRASFKRLIRVKNIAGTLTVLNTSTIGTDYTGDAPLSTCTVGTSTSGTNLLIQVTGVAATTISEISNGSYKIE